MDEIGIGVIGVGGMGTHHAREIESGAVPRARLAAVCDCDPRQLVKFGDAIAKFAESGELIRSDAVDAVVIATPHYAHTTIGIDALAQGLHTLVEKPISVHKADCLRLIEAYTNRPNPNQVFAAMFNQRTEPCYRRVKALIDGGELGELRRIAWIMTNWFRTQNYYDQGGWRATWEGEGGGVLLNQCPHQLDLLQWLCGRPSAIRAFCHLGKYHDIEVEDEVTAYLEYPNGATGVFITSTGEAPGTNRLEIAGERGKLVVEGGAITFWRNEIESSTFSRTSQAAFAVPTTWECRIPGEGEGGGHRAVLRNFVDAILGKAELLAPAVEGIHSVEIGNAMLLSSLTGQTVDLPLDAAVFEQRLKQLIAQSTVNKKCVTPAATDVDMSASFR